MHRLETSDRPTLRRLVDQLRLLAIMYALQPLMWIAPNTPTGDAFVYGTADTVRMMEAVERLREGKR